MGSKGPDPKGLMLWAQLPGNHMASSPKWGRQGDHTTYCPSQGWADRLNWLCPWLNGPLAPVIGPPPVLWVLCETVSLGWD